MKTIKCFEENGKKEWCCGCDLDDTLICGDLFGRGQHILCDKCYDKLKEKI